MQAKLLNVSGNGLSCMRFAQHQNNLINPRLQLTGFCVWRTKKGLLGVCLERYSTNNPLLHNWLQAQQPDNMMLYQHNLFCSQTHNFLTFKFPQQSNHNVFLFDSFMSPHPHHLLKTNDEVRLQPFILHIAPSVHRHNLSLAPLHHELKTV